MQTGPGIPHELLRQLPKIPKIPSSAGGGMMGPPHPPDSKKRNDNPQDSKKKSDVQKAATEEGLENCKERFLFQKNPASITYDFSPWFFCGKR